MKVATIIIPIRCKNIDDNILRLKRLLNRIPSEFEVCVIDDGSSNKASEYIRKLSEKKAIYYYINSKWKSFSLSRARNTGLKIATTPVSIFHDVDFIASPEIYNDLAQLIDHVNLKNKPENFFCVPVAFLTEQGTKNYLKDSNLQNSNYWRMSEHPNHPTEDVQFIVKGSSCIVANVKHLIEIGGHDESYTGHGAEDFELLHRLGEEFPKWERPENYSLNYGSGFISEYKGFRAYFSKFSTVCDSWSIALIHLWHPKRKGLFYYKHKKNFSKLKVLMDG